MSKTIELSGSQFDFHESSSKRTLFCGGLGSGKTFSGALWSASMTSTHPNAVGLITANSYSQLRKATLVMFFELLDKFSIKYTYNKNEGIININDTIIYTISMENYDTLRGIEVGWCWSDECSFYKEEAFNVLMGRIRSKDAPCTWRGTTTPNGFNWLYEKFVETPLPNSEVIYSKTTDNLSNLDDDYVSLLESSYDTRLAQQELGGQFVNLNAGKVYYAFDRRAHVKPVPDNGRLIYIGLDFNVHPLCGVYCIQDGDKIKIVDEIYLENSNTFEVAKEIIKRYPFQGLNIVCDETGNRRKSSSVKINGAYQTDHEILRRANLPLIKFRNPAVKDRYNNTNRLLERGNIIIDPKCKHLIKDLEQLVHDNKDDMLSHISDALGYVCWHLDPLKKPKRSASVSYM